MNPLKTLRGRLVFAMVLILLLALGISTLLDRINAGAPPDRAGQDFAESEPWQDGLVLAGYSIPALILIWLVSSWSLRPLARASEEARRVGPLHPDARLSQAGLPAEIAPLVEAVNGALDRMAAAVSAERRFTENAAHELRTPLAVLGMRLQRARDTQGANETALDWPAIERDLGDMNRLVSQLLDLARKENAGRTATAQARVNLSRIAREACAAIIPMADAGGRALEIALPDAMPVNGAADDLRDAIRNLLENALQHGAGTIIVQGGADAQTAEAVLRISDAGPGVPPGQEQAVFERFNKNAGSGGSGLGLAIVREVVRAQGGSVVIGTGRGCPVEMRLPSA